MQHTPFHWPNPYASQRSPVFARNLVATSHPLAAQAGLKMLGNGGNAIDAAIAAAAAMTILEPCSNGLGSDLFAIVWDGTQLHGLNASGGAPQAWTPQYMRGKHGNDITTPPKRGWDSVTVPGAVAGWVALADKLGTLPLADLLAPAIEIAERGYPVPPVIQHKWAAAAVLPELTSQPGFADTFMPHGRAPQVGERFALPDAARTLALIARTKGEGFYRGEVAQAAERHAREHGGAMTAADFAAYAPEWVQTISQRYRDVEVHEIPPNGQGIAALIALGMLEHFDLASMAIDSAACQHLQIEAMKLAFADTYAFVSEPRTMRVTPAQMLDASYLAERAKLIDPRRAQDFAAGNPVRGGTIYLTAADAQGRMVSLIQSNYMGFGSGVVIPGYGVSLQNRGHGFTLAERHANVVGPGKRPFHTIIPGFVMRDGAPLMSFGVMGGNMQPQGHVQTLVRMIDHAQQPQAACDAPRWRFNQGLDLNVEAAMSAATVEALRGMGHRIDGFADSYQDFGAGQFIWLLGDPGDPAVDGYVAASDSRRDGAAVGF